MTTPPSNLSLSGIRRRRTGKIARLPETVRAQINQMLDDGLLYATIIEKLGESGRGLNYHNLKHWRRGGYQDHLKSEFRKEHANIRDLFVRKLVDKTAGPDLPSATVQMLAAQFFDVLLDFDPMELQQELQHNGTTYTRMLNSVSRLSHAGLITAKERAKQHATPHNTSAPNLG